MARNINKKNKSYSKNIAPTVAASPVPNIKIRLHDLVSFDALTANQATTKTLFRQKRNLVLSGVAGTGKTYSALALAFEQVLDPSSDYKKVIIVRSTVATREIGFLKGTKEEKEDVFKNPYRDICTKLFNSNNAYEILEKQGSIEFVSTAHIRGITRDDAIIIVDEMQNLNFQELDTVITRAGVNVQIVFCGDYLQSDAKNLSDKQGILTFLKVLDSMHEFSTVTFGVEDIVRGPLVKAYIIAKIKAGLV